MMALWHNAGRRRLRTSIIDLIPPRFFRHCTVQWLAIAVPG